MPTTAELGVAMKKKHPGKYDDVSDEALGQAVKRKNPGSYDDFVDAGVEPPVKVLNENIPGKEISTAEALPGAVAETGVGFVKGLGKKAAKFIGGASAIGEDILSLPMKAFGKKSATGEPLGRQIAKSEMMKPKGAAEKIGHATGTALEILAPVPGMGKVKAATKLARFGRMAAEGAAGTVMGTAAEMAGRGATAGQTAAASAVAVPIGAVAGPPLAAVGKFITGRAAPLTQKAAAAMDDAISKGIKPYFSSATNSRARKEYYHNARRAFGVILRNKPSLTDAEGITSVRVPESRLEMSEAIEQAKKKIYRDFNRMAVASGQEGAGVDVTPVIDDLRVQSDNVGHSKQVREYAKQLADDMGELMGQAPEVVETRIKEMNSNLKNFFMNPDRIGRAKAEVDASVASRLREKLDDAITESVGSGYQGLKNDYRALKTVEKDIGRQVAVEMRKSGKGLIDMTDIFTGASIIESLATANPAALIRGVGGRGIKEWYKFVSDPNRFIKNAFKILETTLEKKGPTETSEILPGLTGMKGYSGPIPPPPVTGSKK